jgi:hypothetical protein
MSDRLRFDEPERLEFESSPSSLGAIALTIASTIIATIDQEIIEPIEFDTDFSLATSLVNSRFACFIG